MKKLKNCRKLLAIMLAASMMIGSVPMNVYASEVETSIENEVTMEETEKTVEETAEEIEEEVKETTEKIEEEAEKTTEEETEKITETTVEKTTEESVDKLEKSSEKTDEVDKTAEKLESSDNFLSGFSLEEKAGLEEISGTDYLITSNTQYSIAPGIKENKLTTVTKDGSKQTVGFAMEIDMSNQYVDIATGYGNLDPKKQGWTMKSLSNQVETYEKGNQGVNVVGGVNASLFNMETGQPEGVFIMQGIRYQQDTYRRPYFARFSDGSIGIFENGISLEQAEKEQSQKVGKAVTIKEGVAGWDVLVKNGELTPVALGTNKPDGTYHPVKGNYPRSTIGIKEDGTVVLFQADGKQSPRSVGYTVPEVAYLMKQQGCVDVMELDEGGSSCYVSQREGDEQTKLRNIPSDGSERMISTSILVLSTVPASGDFDHAILAPNGELYTPNSTVELSGFGVDLSGGKASEIPSGASWELSQETAHMGTIRNGVVNGNDATAEFISNGTEGEVEVQLVLDGKVIGSTTIGIFHPDKLKFQSDSINLDYEQVSDLGLHASYKGQAVNLKAEDITWNIADSKAGKFEGLNFIVTDNYLVSVETTVTVVYKENVEMNAKIQINVGMEPSVVMDGGDADGWKYDVFGRGAGSEGAFKWEKENENTCDLITVHYINTGGSSRGGNESAEQITTDDAEWVEKIRFGRKAVKLNYDFSKANGIEGACLGFARDMDLTGSPTGIGVWVYAPEGTTNLWLRAAIGVETAPGSGKFTYTYVNFTERADTAYNASNGKDFGGINWNGWKYVEADISQYAGRTIRIMRGETVRVMYTYGKYGPTIDGKVTGMGNLTKDGKYVPQADVKGWLLMDNLQFVYGTNTQDTVNPEITKFEYSNDGMNWKNLDDDAVLDSNQLQFRVWYEDSKEKDKFNSGVADVQFYFDENHWGRGTPSTSTGVAEYNTISMELPNGQHGITFFVKDNYGNTVRKTKYFTVNDEANVYTTLNIGEKEGAASVLGGDYALELTTNRLDNFKSMNLHAEINNRFEVTDVEFADGVNGTYDWKSGSLKINITDITSQSFIEKLSDKIKSLYGEEQVLATIHINIPENLPNGSQVNWQVTNCKYEVNEEEAVGGEKVNVNYGLSTPMKYSMVQGSYELTAETMIVGLPAVIKTIDNEGNAAAELSVYCLSADGDVLLGTTDKNGVLKTDLLTKEASKWTLYAVDKNGARSFAVETESFNVVGEDKPYNVLSNAVKDPKTQKNFSWMVNPLTANSVAQMRVSLKEDMSNAKVYDGTCSAFSYSVSKNANYICKVTAKNLKAGTTYYYQVGDGKNWSEINSFDTESSDSKETNFFVIGDMQGEDATRAAEFSKLMQDSGIDYSFGIQTGDAIDNVQRYEEWQNMMNIYSKGVFTQVDNLHVMGNHEVFNGDNNGDRAIAAFGMPIEKGTDWYSMEYGNVYVATIGYTLDTTLMKEALEWLVADASASDCRWKMLAIHVPVYYTNKEQSDSAFFNKYLPEAAQKAGIDFVFSGHDHSYARTKAMIDGKEDSNGVVYYIVGTAGEKKYSCTDNGFGFDVMTQDYGAIYLSVTSDKQSITVNAYNVDDNGNATVLDTYTKEKTKCADDEHDYIYDRNTGILNCIVCDDSSDAKEIYYAGFARDKETQRLMYFVAGNVGKGHIADSGNHYFFEDNGLAMEGNYKIGGETCQFKDGIFISCSTADVIVAGLAGKDVDFVLYSDGRFILTGLGNMEEYEKPSVVPWNKWVRNIKSIKIDRNIEYIGSNSFNNAYSCTNVDFGENSQLNSIGSGAFSYMVSLKKIVIPNGVSKIRGFVFRGSDHLESVQIPGIVTDISDTAFRDCNFEKLVLNVVSGSYAENWAKSKGIKFVTRVPDLVANGKCGVAATWKLYSDGVLKIDGNGEMDNYKGMSDAPWYIYRGSITKVEIGADITLIGDYGLYAASLEKVSFAKGSKLNKLGNFAFFNKTKLKEITLPDSVKRIEYKTFEGCKGLEKVYIPDGMAYMHDAAFNNCDKTKLVLSVAQGSYAENWAKRNNVKYEVREVPVEKPIASGKCGANATWELYGNGVLKIGGSGAMDNYKGMSDAPWYDYRGGIIQAEIGADITLIGDYGLYAASLEKVSFAKGSKLNKLGNFAFFNRTKLKEITLPDSVKRIEYKTFEGCKGLEKVYIPDGMAYMHDAAFNNCDKTKLVLSVAQGSYAENWAKRNNVKYEVREVPVEKPIASGKCGANATWELYGNGVLKIGGSGAMDNYKGMSDAPWYDYRGGITQAEIGADITLIGDYGLYAASLEKVSFAKGSKLNKLGNFAFFNRTKLKEITLPDSVKRIEYKTFEGCKGLEKVYIPDGMAYMHDAAFNNCDKTKLVLSVAQGSYAENWAKRNNVKYEVREVPVEKPIASGKCGANATWELYGNGVLKIGGSGAMDNYKGMSDAPWYDYRGGITQAEIGADITLIGDYGLYAASLEKVSFAKGSKLNKLGNFAFFNRTKLKEITLPDSVKRIEYKTFEGCKGLEKVYIPDGMAYMHDAAFNNCDKTKLVLSVAQGSYAENWAKRNNVKYVVR